MSNARKSSATRTAPAAARGVPGWLVGIFGFLCGLTVAVVYYLLLLRPQEDAEARNRALIAAQQSHVTPAEDNAPQFDFYNVLPNQVLLNQNGSKATPEPAAPAVATEAAPGPVPTTAAAVTTVATPVTLPAPAAGKPGTEHWQLQTGSFRSMVEADRRRGEITLLGLSVKVQTVKVKEGETWYRVIVGPFNSGESVRQAQSLLQQHSIDSLSLRMRG